MFTCQRSGGAGTQIGRAASGDVDPLRVFGGKTRVAARLKTRQEPAFLRLNERDIVGAIRRT